MGSQHSALLVWCFQSTVVPLYVLLFLGQANLTYYSIVDHGFKKYHTACESKPESDAIIVAVEVLEHVFRSYHHILEAFQQFENFKY